MRRIMLSFILITALAAPAFATSKAMQKTLGELKATTGDYTFAVVGDNRSGDRVYAKIAAGMMQRKPNVVFNTGDLIPHPGNRDQWDNFWELSKVIDVPYFLAPGNHDVDDAKSLAVWRDEVDFPGREDSYAVVVGKDLFVVLDTCEPGHDRKIEGAQLAWLEKTLDPKRYRYQFVILHHPLFLWKGATHYKSSLDKYPKLRDRLHRLFVEKQVTAVFAGHEHSYKRWPRDGIEYVVTGGAGAPLYGGFNHFMLIEVRGDVVHAKVIDRDGAMRDRFYIRSPKSGG